MCLWKSKCVRYGGGGGGSRGPKEEEEREERNIYKTELVKSREIKGRVNRRDLRLDAQIQLDTHTH